MSELLKLLKLELALWRWWLAAIFGLTVLGGFLLAYGIREGANAQALYGLLYAVLMLPMIPAIGNGLNRMELYRLLPVRCWKSGLAHAGFGVAVIVGAELLASVAVLIFPERFSWRPLLPVALFYYAQTLYLWPLLIGRNRSRERIVFGIILMLLAIAPLCVLYLVRVEFFLRFWLVVPALLLLANFLFAWKCRMEGRATPLILQLWQITVIAAAWLAALGWHWRDYILYPWEKA